MQTSTASRMSRCEKVERVNAVRSEAFAGGVATTFGEVITGSTSPVAPVFTAGASLPLVVTPVMPTRGATEESLVVLSAEPLRWAGPEEGLKGAFEQEVSFLTTELGRGVGRGHFVPPENKVPAWHVKRVSG